MSKTSKSHSTLKLLAVTVFTTALIAGFFPGSASAAETPLSMGTSSTYAVLASAAVTSATASSASGSAGGDIGVGGATAPSGPLTSTGATVLGGSSLAALTAASNALADNRGGTVTGVELGAGRTITPGAYTNPTLAINGTLTLDGLGDSSAVFIFRAASTLITGASSTVLLTNGAQACNVYWQIGSSATLGISSTIVGHVIASASVSTGASTTVNGQLIGTTGSVTLGGTTIINNSCSVPVVVTPTPTPVVTPVVTPTPTPTPTPVLTPTPTPTPTPVVTPTPTPVVTPVVTPTPTPTEEVLEPVDETTTGGELPATSTPWGNLLLAGGGLILLGGIGFSSRKILNN